MIKQKMFLLLLVGIFMILIQNSIADTLTDRLNLVDGIVQDKLRNQTYQEELRSKDTFRESNNEVLTREKFKTHDYRNKTILIEDYVYRDLFKGELLTGYGDLIMIGENVTGAKIRLYDWDNRFTNFDGGVQFYDKHNNYINKNKTYYWEYGIDSIGYQTCEELEDIITHRAYEVCEDVIVTNWTKFSDLSELPHKNITIRLIIDNTNVREEGEWIATIFGFPIIVWNNYIATFGTALEFAFTKGKFDKVVHLKDDYFFNAYQGSANDGWSVLLKRNGFSLTRPDIHEWNTAHAGHLDMIRIEDDSSDCVSNTCHALIIFRTSNGDLRATTVKINLTTETISTVHSLLLDGSAPQAVQYVSIVKKNGTDYVFCFRGVSGWGWCSVVVLDSNYIISDPTGGNFTRITQNFMTYNDLLKYNETHYIRFYTSSGLGNDGFTRTMVLNETDYTFSNPAGAREFDTNHAEWISAVAYNSTIYIINYEGANNIQYLKVIELNNTTWTLQVLANTTVDVNSIGHTTLIKMNDTRYAMTYSIIGSDGQFKVFDFNVSDYSFTEVVGGEFANTATYNSLAEIENNTESPYFFVNTRMGLNDDGYANVLSFGLDSCVPPSSGNWDIFCYHTCVLQDNYTVFGNITTINTKPSVSSLVINGNINFINHPFQIALGCSINAIKNGVTFY